MKRRIISILLFVIGFVFCSYPLLSNVLSQIKQQKIIDTYQSEIREKKEHELSQHISDAISYNECLAKWQKGISDVVSEEMITYEYYQTLLNVSQNDIMAHIEIPAIDVKIPIYHGTEDSILASAIGHVYGSSLPVGGTNTHCLLTGHSGMPEAKLFSRLDELGKGDFFHINVCGNILSYKVTQIQVIEPAAVDTLKIESNKDMVSLITCTPYGLNTHRLVVTGERTDDASIYNSNIDTLYHTMSIRELAFTILPFVFLVLALISGIKFRKERRKREEKRQISDACNGIDADSFMQ